MGSVYGDNYVNILRRLNAKAKHIMNSFNKGHIQHDAVKELMLEVCSYGYVDYSCYECMHNDIGYCGLRRSNMTTEYIHLNFCIPAFIKWSDNELSSHRRKT